MISKLKTVIMSVAVYFAVTFSVLADEYNIIDPVTQPQLYCLALNIYFEARGEDTMGQYAVADVTLNRVEATEFPNTICEVVFQCRTANSCQFSWVHQRRNPQNPTIAEREAWHDAQLYAFEIKKWDVERGITNGATYFHANYARPYWRKIFEETTTIGRHIFYVDPGTRG